MTRNISKVKIGIFLFLTILFLILLNNRLQNNITKMHVDEIHTINIGVHSLYSGKNASQRGDITVIVGEGTRWLARLIYPAALYYMNTKMGGDIALKGIKYSSGYYLEQKLYNSYSINNDPNIQDFVFAMKFILSAFVILSFLIASYLLSNKYGFISGIFYYIISMSTLLINDMLLIFYTESTMVILFNIIVILALNKSINKWRLYVWSAFILAFAISTKLTGIMYVLPILMIIIMKDKDIFKYMKIELFILLTIIFIFIFHLYSFGNLMEVLNQTLVNVYHYKTGHGGNTVISGMNQSKHIINALTPWIYIFPISILFFIFNKIYYRGFIYMVSLSAFIIIMSLVNTNLYSYRNITTPLIMILFVVSIFASTVFIKNKYQNQLVKVFSFLILICYVLFSFNSFYKPINTDSINKYTQNCNRIALIDIESNSIKNAYIEEGIPDEFNLKKSLNNIRKKFSSYDCVAINRIKNNKQLTNYILPLDYKSFNRVGNYFIFTNRIKKSKNEIELEKKIKELRNYSLLATSKFNIYLNKNKLIFYKLACYDKHINGTFDLSIKYADSKRDNSVIKYKATTSNNVIPGTCYFEITLSESTFSSIKIIQRKDKQIIWEEKIEDTK